MKKGGAMRLSYIFYGTLKDSGLLSQICGILPIEVQLGFIKGSLYKITDYSEPHQVYSYPIAILNEAGLDISAKLTTFEDTEEVITNVQSTLKDFEGPLYEQTEATLTDSSNVAHVGLIFVNKKDIEITSISNIEKIKPVGGIYRWE